MTKNTQKTIGIVLIFAILLGTSFCRKTKSPNSPNKVPQPTAENLIKDPTTGFMINLTTGSITHPTTGTILGQIVDINTNLPLTNLTGIMLTDNGQIIETTNNQIIGQVVNLGGQVINPQIINGMDLLEHFIDLPCCSYSPIAKINRATGEVFDTKTGKKFGQLIHPITKKNIGYPYPRNEYIDTDIGSENSYIKKGLVAHQIFPGDILALLNDVVGQIVDLQGQFINPLTNTMIENPLFEPQRVEQYPKDETGLAIEDFTAFNGNDEIVNTEKKIIIGKRGNTIGRLILELDKNVDIATLKQVTIQTKFSSEFPADDIEVTQKMTLDLTKGMVSGSYNASLKIGNNINTGHTGYEVFVIYPPMATDTKIKEIKKNNQTEKIFELQEISHNDAEPKTGEIRLILKPSVIPNDLRPQGVYTNLRNFLMSNIDLENQYAILEEVQNEPKKILVFLYKGTALEQRRIYTITIND